MSQGTPSIEVTNKFVEHIAPAGVGALDFESPGAGLDAQLLPHGPARSEVKKFVDDSILLIEERTRLRAGG